MELAGADIILICTNTMHKVFTQVQSAVKVPLLHIASATADALEKERIKSVGLLVTPETSELPIFDTTVIHAMRAAALSYEE